MKKIDIYNNLNISLTINGEKHSIRSLSTEAITFEDNKSSTQTLSVNESLSAQLSFSDESCLVSLVIMAISSQVTDKVFEAKFIDSSDGSLQDYKVFIENYFHPEINAILLKKIPKEKINNTGKGTPHWYYGGTEYEIFFNEEKGKVVSFQINFATEMLTLDGDELTVGSLWEGSDVDRISHKGAHLIKDKKKISSSGMKNLYRFVSACPGIEKEFLEQILDKIEKRFKKDWE